MADYISFPSNGNFIVKIRIMCFIIIKQRNSGDANLKKVFGKCLIKTGSKMFCHLESKSFSAFNFIGVFALKIVQ